MNNNNWKSSPSRKDLKKMKFVLNDVISINQKIINGIMILSKKTFVLKNHSNLNIISEKITYKFRPFLSL